MPIPTTLDPERDVRHRKDFGVLAVPAWLRHDPARQPDPGRWTQIGLSLGCTFVVANLYYCQPLLIEIANSFQETYATVAWIPTMYQAGYCVGLFFISPLGDLVRRRQLIMALVCMTTCLSADLAVPQHRARVVSILQSGLMLGILLARVLSGIIGYFSTWRTVYYMAIGMQAVVLCGAYVLIPDHPPKNPHLTYLEILHTMVTYSVTEPRLVQAALINIASVACWSNFWVTLTFLLGDEPYHFSTLYIGLFGLIGILGIFSGPLASRFIDQLGAWYSVLVATLCLLVLQSLEMAAGGINIAVVVVVCFGIDAFRQTQTVSLQTIVFSISEEARSRLNAILTVSLFAGQVIGSSAGSHVFLRYGWRAAAGLSVGLYVWQLFVLFVRGPNCGRHVWFGYDGGFALGEQKQCQERMETASHGASVGSGTVTGMTTQESIEMWTPGSSWCPEERCMNVSGLKNGKVEEGMW
ncbi:major facilitator superfamily domain-containing protein [Butyriboletus roseoflavus]|nr:major facilitator superfamily domain-containing protein [Butyriboletus roseoflavus]